MRFSEKKADLGVNMKEKKFKKRADNMKEKFTWKKTVFAKNRGRRNVVIRCFTYEYPMK